MKNPRRCQSGVAAVELALLLVPLVILVFGISEFGRAIYQYNAIGKAVRTGARYLSQYQAGNNWGVAKDLVVCGKQVCSSAQPIVPLLTTAMVDVADASSHANMKQQAVTANGSTVGVTNLVRVTVSGYRFTPLIPIFGAYTFGPISATMMQALT